MPKAARAFIEHACYHIITRGNQKQKVFHEKRDFEKYLCMLKRSCKKYEVCLYAYCLMPNHTHLLVDPAKSAYLSKFMHWLNRGYTAYYNAKYSLVGHLWQGRFKSKPILKNQYLIHCSNYIEANPVRANMVKDIAGYPWSSYNERCLASKKSLIDEIIIDQRKTIEETRLILEKGAL